MEACDTECFGATAVLQRDMTICFSEYVRCAMRNGRRRCGAIPFVLPEHRQHTVCFLHTMLESRTLERIHTTYFIRSSGGAKIKRVIAAQVAPTE